MSFSVASQFSLFCYYIVLTMSTDVKTVNRELLTEFILEYQNQPVLWRIKNKEYHDRAKRKAAYDILLTKYRLIDVNADNNTIVKKINSFRSNVRKEKKKIDHSRRSGIGTDEEYKPSLWYYQLFAFLGDQETPRGSLSNYEDKEVGFIYYLEYKHTYCLYIINLFNHTKYSIYLYKTSLHKL